MPDLLRLLLADEMELYEVVFHSNVNIEQSQERHSDNYVEA